MEDTIQIIIFILFFIFSIISSKNKKKKKQQQLKKKANSPHIQSAKQGKLKRNQQEIFEELFGLKPEPEVPPVGVVNKDNKNEESSYKTWYAEDDFKYRKHNDNYSFREKDEDLKEEFAEEDIEHDIFKHTPKDYLKTKKQLEQEKLKHKSLISKQIDKSQNKKKNKYQKLFQNPSSLKDYIVISEILTKPKALRR